MLVRYKPIDDYFAELPNRVFKDMLIQKLHLRGIEMLMRAHSRLYRNMPQMYDHGGRPIADSADVQALYLLMHKVSELTADAALEAVSLS